MEPDDETVERPSTCYTTGCSLSLLVVALLALGAIGTTWPGFRLHRVRPLECPAYLILFVISKPGEGFTLKQCRDYPLPMRSTSSDPVRRALDELVGYDQKNQKAPLDSPLGCARRKRFLTMVPSGTTVLGVWSDADTITVDLEGHALDFRDVEAEYSYEPAMQGKCQLGFLAQMVFTSTGEHTDSGVRILVSGQPVKHLGSGDTDFSRPWHRRELEHQVWVLGTQLPRPSPK